MSMLMQNKLQRIGAWIQFTYPFKSFVKKIR